ncbi:MULTISPECIES: hypothetical protein [unclassified Mesorhizobium]|nr:MULTISPECIES: hypothetical protein [unclassified Mesorhizobium]
MIVNELLFAAFQRPLPYSAAKMKHSQMVAAIPHIRDRSAFAWPKAL